MTERRYEWVDPAVTAAAGTHLAGLDFLRAIAAGDLPRPPSWDTLGIDPVELEPGRVVFRLVPGEWLYNPLGVVHGGIVATLADTALGCAVHTRLPAGTGVSTLEVSVNFVRPVTVASGPIRAEGTVLSLGRRTGTARTELTDGAGKLYAHGTTTCLIFPVP